MEAPQRRTARPRPRSIRRSCAIGGALTSASPTASSSSWSTSPSGTGSWPRTPWRLGCAKNERTGCGAHHRGCRHGSASREAARAYLRLVSAMRPVVPDHPAPHVPPLRDGAGAEVSAAGDGPSMTPLALEQPPATSGMAGEENSPPSLRDLARRLQSSARLARRRFELLPVSGEGALSVEVQ